MPTLTVNADYDYTGEPETLAGGLFALVDFTAAARLGLSSTSINANDVSLFATIDGSSGINEIYITVASGETVITLADWSFVAWESDDLVTIEGGAAAETITGSVKRDLVFIGGPDVVDGGDDDDIFRVFGIGTTPFGAQIDGGNGTDRFQVVGTLDLRTITTIANVEGLEDISGATTAQLGSDQVGAGKINIFNSSQPTALALQVFGSTADLSTATFGTWGAEDSVTLFGTAGVDTLKGSSKRDTLLGGASNDTLFGNDGNDILTGGAGRDTMTGGTGLDDFDFNKVAEIGKTSSTRDKIIGFTHLQDDIDLSTIDANGSASGDKAFTFLATKDSVFTGIRGQVRWFQINTSGTANDKTIIEGDVNGDEKADFQIELVGLKTLTKADFIL